MSVQPNDWLMDGGAVVPPRLSPEMVRGKLTAAAPLAPLVWFKAGGPADWLFEPADLADLRQFLAIVDGGLPVMALGLGSNLIVTWAIACSNAAAGRAASWWPPPRATRASPGWSSCAASPARSAASYG